MQQKYLPGLLLGLLLALVCAAALPAPRFQPEDLRLLALAPDDGRAVVQTPDRQLHTVAVGEALPGSTIMLRQVLPAMLVLEAAGDSSAGPQHIWMMRAGDGPTPPLRRFHKTTPALPAAAPARVMSFPAAGPVPEIRTGKH